MFICTSCHHGYTHPLPDTTTLSKFYEQAPIDQSFIQEEPGRRRTAQKVIKRIQSINASGKKLIDLGCGPGLFVSEANNASYETSGIESSTWAHTFATKTLTLPNIMHNDLDSAFNLPPQSFDIITAFDLIEHLIIPRRLIQAAKHLLKPGGLLVLTAPRFDSLAAKSLGNKWHALFPEHLHYFSTTSLNHLLTASNFSITKLHSHTRYFSPNYLLTRILHRPISISSFPFNQNLPINLGDEMEVYAVLK